MRINKSIKSVKSKSCAFAWLGLSLLTACTSPSGKLQDGIWRGELAVRDKQAPFLFEVQQAETDSAVFTLINGEERVPLTGIQYVADTEGKIVSMNDERYKNKVVIVSVLGSWCPNCLDELKFLAPWYRENKDRGVEIIGLAFERKNDFGYAQTAINRLKKRFDVEYEILFAGRDISSEPRFS